VAEAFVNLDNARLEEQRKVMQAIAERGECPFDEENLAKTHGQPILRRGEQWTLTYNQWPYDNTKLHLLAITRYHAHSLGDLRSGAGEELFEHLKWAEDEFFIAAGGLGMRFGNIKLNGATVDHLHAHLIVADPKKPVDKKIRFKMSP
jgi:diadenosine tetraphosphate (Ap4A) HIT family hydrolase